MSGSPRQQKAPRSRPSRAGHDVRHPDAVHEPVSVSTWQPIDLSQALVVIGFPGAGLVGSLASAHLVESLRLKEVGYVLSPAFPPTSVVRGGMSTAPVRIYLGDVVCGVDGECEQLCVVHSDMTPKSSFVATLAHALVSWAKERAARMIVCLEGLANSSEGAGARLFGVANDAPGRAFPEKIGVGLLDDGLLMGIGGVVLYAARVSNLPAVCLLAETRKDFPDAHGAARLPGRLRPILPLLPIEEAPLVRAGGGAGGRVPRTDIAVEPRRRGDVTTRGQDVRLRESRPWSRR